MVTGRVPFTADTPLAVILKHISDPMPLPSALKTDIPAPIEQVILKALAKEPQDRFATAAEFLSAWKRALDEKDYSPRASKMISTPASIPPALGSVTKPLPNLEGLRAGQLAVWQAHVYY
jgi:serine/threonine protein kinase